MSAITLFFGAMLGLISWLAPNHYLPWLSFHAEVLMAAAFLLVLIGELSRSPAARLSLSPLIVTTLLLTCVPLLQVWAGLIVFAGDAWMVFEYLLAFALAQMLGQMLTRRLGVNAMFEGLSALFLAASMACVGLQLIQWLRLPGLGIFSIDLAPGHSPYANVAQPNHLSVTSPALDPRVVRLQRFGDRDHVHAAGEQTLESSWIGMKTVSDAHVFG